MTVDFSKVNKGPTEKKYDAEFPTVHSRPQYMILLFHQGVYVITRSIHVFDGISYIYLININQNVGKYTIHIHIHGWHEVKKQKSLYDVNSRKPF